MYLSGYAVECLLKAYIVQHWKTQTLKDAQDAINKRRQQQGKEKIRNIARSAAGHDIFLLLQVTDVPLYPGYVQEVWGQVGKWGSNWRYETDRVERSDAEDFLNNIKAAIDWLQPKIL